ncbi:nitrous oxide-stimulated promoter family protein [Prolixibacter sp. SD074]|uniref:nitrous oxide-stimulated promoter family protein n=1 Tax=Prolixibacter sp. SD074 TaxID=2652391 RepID=UPI0012801E06|nr:nitrous oxide-stimulated promoter family protein [Prolixibacter sp. SD074]GET29052.1 hypothetical protein SD074_12540 [Prolixibacter sp. SD074]
MTGKRSEEKQIVTLMIELYCRKNHRREIICFDCEELIDYAAKRLDNCVFGDEKPACKHCPVHCYKPAMRERIREVMRWAGPRMILYRPGAAVRHMLSKPLQKRMKT